MAATGRKLADAYVKVHADMSSVGPDVDAGLNKAVTKGSRAASGKVKDTIGGSFKAGFADGVRQADPGGAAVGGKLRQSMIGKLRGIGQDTVKAGADAGAGIDRGVSGKMRDVAATTSRGGKAAGEGFTRSAGDATKKQGGYLTRAASSTAGDLVKGFAVAEVGMKALDLFGGFIADARESAKIGALTAQVIKSTGGAARLTADDVSALATATSNKTGVDDEAIQSGENLLLTFTSVRNEVGAGNDIFSQATGIMTDMSVALGQDMKSSAIQLGKALNDPIKGVSALQRVGVSFTASQKDQIKTLVQSGKTMDAQKIILAELGHEFGGAAAAAATPVDRLRVIAGNLGEQIGTALIPAVDKVANVLADDVVPAVSVAVGALSSIPAPVYAAAAGAVALYGAFKVGKGVFGAVESGVKTLGTAMQWMGLRTGEAAAAEGVQTAAAGRQVAANDAAAASATRLGRATGALAKAGLAAGAAFVAVQVSGWANETAKATVPTDELTASVAALGTAGDVGFRKLFNRAGFGNFKIDAQSSAEALDMFQSSAAIAFGSNWTDRAQRLATFGTVSSQAEAQIRDLDGALAKLAESGQGGAAAASFTQLAARMRAAGVAEEDITRAFPQYTAAAAKATDATNAAASAAKDSAAAHAIASGAQVKEAVTLKALLDAYPKYKDVVLAAVGATTADGAETKNLTAAQVAAARAAVTHKAALDGLNASLDASKNALLTARGAENSYWGALQAVRDALKENGRTLDLHTTKGRANRAAVDALASSSLNYLGTINKNVKGGVPFRRTLDQQWKKLYDAERRFGATKAEAKRYADGILAIPRAQALKVTQPGMAAARAAVQGLKADITHLSSKNLKIALQSAGDLPSKLQIYAQLKNSAEGGPVAGPGGPTADRVGPYMLSNGEYVVNARAAGQHRDLLDSINYGRARGMATGGAVSDTLQVRGSTDRRFPKKGALPGWVNNLESGIVKMMQVVAANVAENVGGGAGMTWQQEMAILRGAFPKIQLISGYRKGARTTSGATSYHASGRAVDVTPSMAIFNWIASHYPSSAELIYSPAGNRQIHNGRHHMYTGAVRAMHFNHVHWAYGAGGGAGGPQAGFTGAGQGNAGNKRLGQSLAASYGWTGNQWLALRSLWQGESGWNNRARNPSSGAYGIPQALPAGKMGRAANPPTSSAYAQEIWGLRYIKGAYGNPLNAWNKWNARHPHWYGAGTSSAAPGWARVGEFGPELVNFRGGEQVKTAAATRAAAGDGTVRLHPDDVAALGRVLGAALARQPVILDGRTVAGYVDRAMGRSSLSVRG